jgi:hypothetical protein
LPAKSGSKHSAPWLPLMSDDPGENKKYNEKHRGCDDTLLDELLEANKRAILAKQKVAETWRVGDLEYVMYTSG